MKWIIISCILCVFGCFKEFRPSESFVTDYLTGPWKNFTEDQVNREIFPISTYSYLATIVVVFLITDFVRYKPIIILCGLSGTIAFLLLILRRDILSMQILEFLYGLFFSTEVAYYTYIYAKVDKKHYQEVTSHTKAASLFGRCMAGIIAQLTVSFNILDYHQLNYLTVTAISFATIWAIFLPSVGQSIYFHRKSSCHTNDGVSLSNNDTTVSEQSDSNVTLHRYEQRKEHTSLNVNFSVLRNLKQAYVFLWQDFLQAYSNTHVVKWSIWWSFSTCGYLQVISYIQLLWKTAVSPGDQIYNGAVDALYTIIDSPDEDESEFTGVSKFSDRTTLKMLEDITAKVWRTLPVINVPQSWVLAYCMKFTEISEEVEKATMQCQYDGTDWDCTFIELGGGHDDFNVGKIVSLFHDLSNRGLRLKLLRAAEICGKLWQRYKQIQDKRIIRMRLSVQVNRRINIYTPGTIFTWHSFYTILKFSINTIY